MISTDAFQTDTLSTLGSWLSAASNCLALADAALAARLSNTASLHVHLTTLIEKTHWRAGNGRTNSDSHELHSARDDADSFRCASMCLHVTVQSGE